MLSFPASLILLPATLVAGVAYVTLGRRPPGGVRRVGRAALLAAVWSSPLATSGPGPAQLALGLIVAYLGIRMAALAQRSRGRPTPSAWEVARELITPRTLLLERTTPVRRPGWYVARGLAGMGVCAGLLLLGNWLRLWQWSRFGDDLLVFVEVALGSAGLHQTVVGIAAAIFGRSIRGLLDRPELSTSLSQFWARRWNRLVQADLDRAFFRPLARRGAPRAGLLAAFAASGVMHVVAVLDAGTWEVTLLPAAGVMFFFLLHGGLVLAEQATEDADDLSDDDLPGSNGDGRRHRRQLLGRRVRTMVLFALLSPLLLDPFASVTHVHGRKLERPPFDAAGRMP